MATNVTVLGASGSTVTIPFTSAANAAAAQTALYKISQLVQASVLTQYQYPGTGTVPAPALLGGVVVSGATPVNVGALPTNTWSMVNNADNAVPTVVGLAGGGTVAATLPGTTVVGAFTPMTVASGTSGIMFLNVSSNAEVYLGGGNNYIYERDAAAKAVIGVDAGTSYIEAQMGATTINAFDGAGMLVQAGGTGSTLINAQGGQTSFWVYSDTSGGAAVTLTGASAGSKITYVGTNHASTFLNPGAGDITVFGSFGGDSTGTATLFGGTAALGGATVTAPAFTGAATVYGGTGYFAGGTGGANLMHTSTVTASTTLVGGHDGDTLYNHAAGNFLISGAGAETLFGVQDTTTGGSNFQLSSGDTTVFGDALGGNHFFLGAGLGLIEGSWANTHAIANYYSVANGGGSTLVTDFISGLDKFSVSLSAGAPSVSSLTYYAAGAGGSPFGSHDGTALVLSDSTKVYFYDTQVKTTDLS